MANIETYLNAIRRAVYGKEVRSSIVNAIDAINDEVDDNKEEIDSFVQGEMDTTLTSTTLPAQGKAVGDAINDLKGAFNNNKSNYYAAKILHWEQGSIHTDGSHIQSDTRIRTGKIFVPAEHLIILTTDATNEISVSFYDIEENLIRQTGWSGSRYMNYVTTDCYIAIVQKHYNSSNITPADAVSKLTIYGLTTQHDTIRWANIGYNDETSVTPNAHRVSMIDPILVKKGDMFVLHVGENMQGLYYMFNIKGLLIENSGWLNDDTSVDIADDSVIFITTKKKNGSSFSDAERNVSFTVYNADTRNLINENKQLFSEMIQGGLTNDGTYVSENDLSIRIRMKTKIHLKDNDHVILKSHMQGIYWYLFDENNKIIDKSPAWNYEDQELLIKGEMYFSCTVAKQNRSLDILPSESLVEITVMDDSAYNMSKIARNGNYSYSGEKILFGNHSFECRKYIELSQQPSYSNGCAVWDNKLFIFNNTTVNVYNISDGLYIGEFTLPVDSTCHSNSVTLAPNLHDGNSQYPYFYIDEFYGNGRIYVIDVRENSGIFTGTLVQTININQLTKCGLGFADCAIDFNSNKLLLIRYLSANSFNDDPGNNIIISEFDLPSLTRSNVSLTDDDILKVHTVYHPIYARQQCLYYGGKLYMLAGASLKSYLYVTDLDKMVTVVPISHAINYLEPEGMVLYDGGLLIIPAPSSTVYKLTFI